MGIKLREHVVSFKPEIKVTIDFGIWEFVKSNNSISWNWLIVTHNPWGVDKLQTETIADIPATAPTNDLVTIEDVLEILLKSDSFSVQLLFEAELLYI